MDIDWHSTHAATWRQDKKYLRPITVLDPIGLDSLVGIDDQKNQLFRNPERFLNGRPANNALRWGTRGAGKSSFIKATLNVFKPKNYA
jgi:predicted AAA+ superfamily ATPase